MKLIEALVMVSQQYGIYGDWTAINQQYGRIIRVNKQYFSYTIARGLVGQSERLETVLAKLAEQEPPAIYDEHWKISHYEEYQP